MPQARDEIPTFPTSVAFKNTYLIVSNDLIAKTLNANNKKRHTYVHKPVILSFLANVGGADSTEPKN